jgi:hypothetical protein
MKCEKECNNFVTCRFSDEGKQKDHCNFFISKVKSFNLGKWSDSDIELPPIGVPVLGVIEHFSTGSKRHAVVIYVNDDDHGWEFDGCELANEYSVTMWASLPEF